MFEQDNQNEEMKHTETNDTEVTQKRRSATYSEAEEAVQRKGIT